MKFWLRLALLALLSGVAQAGDLDISVVTAAAASGTPTFTQDFTDSTTFAGATPKAAIVFSMARATAENTNTSPLSISIGIVAGGHEAGIGDFDTDSQGNNMAAVCHRSNEGYCAQAGSGTTVGDANLSLIANGMRMSWTDQSSSEIIKVVLIGGNVEANVVKLVSNNGTSAQTVSHGLAGTPDFIISLLGGNTGDNSDTTGSITPTIGFYTSGAQIVNGGFLNQHAVANVTASNRIDTTHGEGRMGTGTTFAHTGLISNVGATSFDVTMSAAHTNASYYLAVRSTSGTALVVKAGSFTTPTSTGNVADVSGMSTAPKLLITSQSRLTALNAGSTGSDASHFGVGVALVNTGSGSTQYAAASVLDADAAATSGAHSFGQSSNTEDIRILDTAGVADVESTVNSWDSGGVTHNYSNINASALEVTYLAVGAVATGTPPTFSVSPAVGTRTTSTIPITATSACTDCTFYGAAYTDGGTTPTCSAIKAQTVTGGYKYFSAAMTATVQATGTFSTYTSGTIRDSAYCMNSTANGDSSVATIADLYKIPAFSSGPTLSSCGTGGCTYSATLDGAGTIYGVACINGSTAATVTQVEAGNCTGNAAAQASANKAVTGADTLTIGSSLTFPLYDYSIVGVYGSQHEAATHADTGRALTAPTGQQFVTLASISSTSWCKDFNDLATPDIAAGDILRIDSATTPSAFTWTQGTDCDGSYTGDGSRQKLLYDVYDASVSAYMTGGPGVVWFNNIAPAGDDVSILLTVGTAFTTDLCAVFDDAEGDTLTGTNSNTGTGTGADKRPAGTTISNCTWSGTATTPGTGTFTFTATDVAGATDTITVTWQVIDTVTVPDCSSTHVTVSACIDLLAAQFLDFSGTSAYSDTVASGRVISQNPAAAATVAPFTSVALVISRGAQASNFLQRLRHRFGGMRERH